MAYFYKVNKSNASAVNCCHHHNYNRMTPNTLSPSRFFPPVTHKYGRRGWEQPGLSPHSGLGETQDTRTRQDKQRCCQCRGKAAGGSSWVLVLPCICSSCHLHQLLPPWHYACTSWSRQHLGSSCLTHTEELCPLPAPLPLNECVKIN